MEPKTNRTLDLVNDTHIFVHALYAKFQKPIPERAVRAYLMTKIPAELIDAFLAHMTQHNFFDRTYIPKPLSHVQESTKINPSRPPEPY